MADGVRFILDKLAALFRRLEDTELFSHDEVRAIVKKVTDSEYTLKRRQLEVADFHTYLKYVISLDKLLVARVKRLEANTTKVTKELHDMLHAIQATLDNHIIYIFDRSVRRFSSEVVLWNDYIAFLQRKEAVTALNAVFGKALSLYPKNEDFWLQASIHELEANSNVHSARVSLQRALRAIPTSSKLWLRYFELELWNALRSTERQKALEIVEDYEALQGAPMIVFNHALNAVKDINAVLEIYSACETVGGDFALKMQEILISRHGQRKEVWQYLAIAAVSNAAAADTTIEAETATQASKRKLSDADEAQKTIDTVNSVAEGLEKCVAVLNQGAAYRAEVTEVDSQAASDAEYATMTVTTLHQSLLQAQQILGELALSDLINVSAGSASGKKKARKGDKAIADQTGAAGDKNAALERLNDAIKSIISVVDTCSKTEASNKSAFKDHTSIYIAKAVQFEAFALSESLSLSVRAEPCVVSVHQLAAWLKQSVPDISKYVLQHYQYQLSSSVSSAASVAAVDGFCVPVASLLAYLTHHDDIISDAEVSNCLSSLLSRATALVITPTGTELFKRLVELVQSTPLRDVAVSAVQDVITGTHALLSPADRATWSEYYVEQCLSTVSAADTHEMLVSSYQWVDTVIASKPHLFQSAALSSFYEYVIDATQSLLPADSASTVSTAVEQALQKFLESVAEKAVEKCPHEVSFWKTLEEAQQQRGDHKSATHTRWRRDKAISSA